MTVEFPDREERARAEALDAALGRGPRAQRRAGPRSETDDLADLADRLRAAMPMPDLPGGGRTEVRAAALAVRGTKRRDRTKLLVAAAVTLVVGAVGGAALSSAVQQPNPSTDQAAVQVDLNYASGYLAKHDSAKARQYIERASKAILGKAPAPLAAHLSTASEAAAVDALKQDLAVQLERDTRLEAQNAKLSKTLGSMVRIAQADVPVLPTGSTSTTTTTRPRTVITARTTTTSTSKAQVTAVSRYTPPTTTRPTTTPPTTTPPTTTPPTTTTPTTAAPTTTAPAPTVPVPTVPVPTTKPPSRSRGIGPAIPLAQPTTTTTTVAPQTTTPATSTMATATTTTRPKTATTTSGVAPSSTTFTSMTTTTVSTTTMLPATTTADIAGTTTTSAPSSTTTTSP